MIHATVAGNLTRDAELKSVAGGVCEFTVAANRKVKGEEVVTFVRCSIWGKRGEALSRHLTKGTGVVVVGELVLREYQKRDGGAGASLEIRVSDVKLMGGGSRGGSGGGSRDSNPTGGGYSDADYGGGDDDDLPFLSNVSCEHGERWWRRG